MTSVDPAAPAPDERRRDTPESAFRCAVAGRERADPQLGSAPPTRRWLLIEHHGPWPADALAGSQISASVLDLVARTAQAESARPLLIRRPGRSEPSDDRAWAVSYENGLSRWGSWRDDNELERAVEALAAPEPPTSGDAGPILLVCAHGLHDVCCALRGRPVAAALADVWPEETWECSHVGGDRFAANVVVLPDGVYYGLLDPVSAVTAVRSHLSGEVPVDHLRGMAQVPPPAQVAIAAVHRRFGPFGAREVGLAALDHTVPGVWRIELTVPRVGPGPVTVTVASRRRTPARLTCRAPADTPATEYRVVDVSLG